MTMPGIRELCPGEINDFLVDLVRKELRNIPPDFHCRRKELCEAFLACNHEVGNRLRMKEGLKSILQQWKQRQDQIAGLERLGFRMTKGKTHWKIRLPESDYFAAVAATPGDRRSGVNSATNAVSVFF